MEANDQRIEQLKIQSGVEVIKEEDGKMVLTGDISSIISARDKLLKWTNETPGEQSPTFEISSNGQGKWEVQESKNHSYLRFDNTEKGSENAKPNRNTEVQYSRTFDTIVKPKQYNKGKRSNPVNKTLEKPNKGKIFPNMPRNIEELTFENDWYQGLPMACKYVDDDENLFPDVNIDSLMMTTKEGIKVYVYKGNLCYLNVQGIVNSSNEYMNHSSGLSSVIAKAAGKKMKDECMQYLVQNIKLQQGNTCVTTAGNLKHYSDVLHACAPSWTERENTECFIEGIINVIKNALISADDNGLRSVAIPAIGSGKLSFKEQFLIWFKFDKTYSEYKVNIDMIFKLH